MFIYTVRYLYISRGFIYSVRYLYISRGVYVTNTARKRPSDETGTTHQDRDKRARKTPDERNGWNLSHHLLCCSAQLLNGATWLQYSLPPPSRLPHNAQHFLVYNWGERERAPTCGLNGRAVPIDVGLSVHVRLYVRSPLSATEHARLYAQT